MHTPPKILIVDDEPFNVDYLEQELEYYGYNTITASNGQEALIQVEAQNPDLILLDIMMPVMDGFSVLEHMKANDHWSDIPVVVISAMNDIKSVVKGIELGADDYLPKPFNEVLLAARLTAGLERKQLRDNEREYLEQVYQLTEAAQAIEADQFEDGQLDKVISREDELGQLARVFQHMAGKVHAREQQLRQQIRQLQIDIKEQKNTTSETVAVYVPIDRRMAIAKGISLPAYAEGAAMLADISGFTKLSQLLVHQLGPKRGAEEITRQVDQVYEAIIVQIHQFGGSIISFSGDAVTCWFDRGADLINAPVGRAAASAFAIQAAMKAFQDIIVGDNYQIQLTIKIAITAGRVRRFLVGNPAIQHFDIIAGDVLDKLSVAESHAKKGQVIVTEYVASTLGDNADVAAWRTDVESGESLAIITNIRTEIEDKPWRFEKIDRVRAREFFRSWLAPAIFEHIDAGKSVNLYRLRETTALFVTFSGIDYEADSESPEHLDKFVQWFQEIVTENQGIVVQVTVGDKGNYLFAAFGSPVSVPNHALAALESAFALKEDIPFPTPIHNIRIGIASGTMRTGAYGGSRRRSYGNQGAQTNLAARLMIQAEEGILCDAMTYEFTRDQVQFEILPPVKLKSYSEPVSIYRPIKIAVQAKIDYVTIIDQLTPNFQYILKLMSVFDSAIDANTLQAVYSEQTPISNIDNAIQILADEGLLVTASTLENGFKLSNARLREAVYEGMLFGERRQLHRRIALLLEQTYQDELSDVFEELIHHWEHAEDFGKTIQYLEMAATEARNENDFERALAYFNRTLTLQSKGVAS